MGDYTMMTVRVYDCPDESERNAVLDLLLGRCYPNDGDDENLFQQWYEDEASLTDSVDVGKEIAALAPGASFECWTDPKYEYLGSLFACTPQDGVFEQECDSDGNPVFTRKEVLDIVADPTGPKVAAALGLRWESRFEEFRQKQKEAVPA